jgi:NAD(P)-dependent dehydrogenase (short-subunit alcohol dehydrogenase family)
MEKTMSSEKTNARKTVIVTGGSQGIGAGVVRAFLDRGYRVVANSRNISRSNGFTPSDRLALVGGTIAEASTAAKIVEVAKSKFGSIDALVNNAGIYFSKAFTDYTVDDLRSLVSVNIEGFLFISQFAIKYMLAQKTRRKQRQYHVDAGHLALDTAADEITARVRGFVGS